MDRVTQELLARLNEESVLKRVKEEVRKCAQVFRYDEKVDPEVWQSRLYAANGELSKALGSLGETHRIQQRCTELILRIQTLLGSKDTIEAVLAELVRSMGFDRASFLEVSEDGRQAIPTEIVTADGRGSRLEGQALPIDDPAAIPKDHPVAFGRGEGHTQDRWVSFFTVASIVVSPVVEEGRVRYLLATDRGPKPAAETLATDLLVHQLFAPAFGLLLQNDRLFKQAQYLSVTDVLTGVSNRRALMDTIESVSREAVESHQTFCVAMLDLDEFKKLNDECGHQAGDEVLHAVAQTIRTVCRGDDVVGRYGGEEFCLVLPETSLEEGAEVSERVRAAVEQLGRAQAPRFRNRVATVSVGLAALRFGGEDHESLLARADAALYRAKQSGRNRVHVDSEGAAAR